MIQSKITRRDFLNGVALGVGSALLGCSNRSKDTIENNSWYGYGGVGDYRKSHGNTPVVLNDAHGIRDGGAGQPIAPSQKYDLVIVGAGIAGLGAALEFSKKRQPDQTCLILDNHPIFGGEAKENEFTVNGTTLIAPQGANGFFVPPEVNDLASAKGDPRYYAELGIPRELPYREWQNEKSLGFCKDNYGYLVRGLQERTSVGHFFDNESGGRWAVDMWQHELKNTPLSETDRRALLAWYHAGATKKFDDQAHARRYLDGMSYKEFLLKDAGLSELGAKYADLFLASACGLGSDSVSAYAAYNMPMPGMMDNPGTSLFRNSFPGGNSGFARYFLKSLLPGAIHGEHKFGDIVTGKINLSALDKTDSWIRMRLNSTVSHVSHDDSPASASHVRVSYIHQGKTYGVEAKAVVMATGAWINKHIVTDLPSRYREAAEKFHHVPFLVANVALNNWRFMYKLGITAAIWEKGPGDFGYTCNLRQPMLVGRHQPALDPEKPAVLSFYTPFYYPGLSVKQQAILGRAELLSTSYADYESQIIRQMGKLFGASGFDPERDIAGIILNRWGHAYSVPYPGFYGGASSGPAPRDIFRESYGRIAFGHSELDGLQHWGPAADEGRRAVNQVLSMI